MAEYICWGCTTLNGETLYCRCQRYTQAPIENMQKQAPPLAVGCILTGDHEAAADCTQFHDDAPNDCCRYCEPDGQHCGMCERFEPDDEATEGDVRNYVSRVWAEDWDSAEDEALSESGEAHGEEHRGLDFGWGVASDDCLVEVHEYLRDAVLDALPLDGDGQPEPGLYPISFKFDDESIELTVITGSAVTRG